MEKELFEGRLRLYVEVIIVSLVWFIIVALTTWIWFKVMGVSDNNKWAGAAVLIPAFLLPYIVISCRVWGVELSIAGAKGRKTTVGHAMVREELH